jgi:hypothetical protein
MKTGSIRAAIDHLDRHLPKVACDEPFEHIEERPLRESIPTGRRFSFAGP